MSAETSAPTPASIGDLEAIYKQHYPRFLRVAVASLGEIERGRDAVHETFVRAIKSLPAFRGEGSLEAWVWRTLVNVCLVEKRHQPALAESLREPASESEPVDWPEVRAAIAALPERQRTTLFRCKRPLAQSFGEKFTPERDQLMFGLPPSISGSRVPDFVRRG
jgi:DNA-directed RNA polymerase specialized sigma24 family protein